MFPAEGLIENVTKSLFVIASDAEAVVVQVPPPHAFVAAEPLFVTPLPRVRPTTVTFVSALLGLSGEAPKLVSPFTSHAAISAAFNRLEIAEMARILEMLERKRLRLLVAELMSFGCFMVLTQLVINVE